MSFDDEKPVRMVANFSDDDLALLKQYCEHAARLRETRIVKEGISSVISFGQASKPEPPLENAEDEWQFELIGSFLHHLRPLFLEEEPASFVKVAGLIGRRFSHRAMKRHLKVIRGVHERSPFSGFGQITVADVPLWDYKTLKKWLYAFEYHQDPEKKEYLRDIEESIGKDGTRAIFVKQLREQARAYFYLESLARFIIDA